MKTITTGRGFRIVVHEKYADRDNNEVRLIQESSAIGDYPDSMENAGSSYLWVGEHHHLDRQEIEELIQRLQYWLKKGILE